MIAILGNFICSSFKDTAEGIKGELEFIGHQNKKETIFFHKKIANEKELKFCSEIFSNKVFFHSTGKLYKSNKNILYIELDEISPLFPEINILTESSHIDYGEIIGKSNFIPPKR